MTLNPTSALAVRERALVCDDLAILGYMNGIRGQEVKSLDPIYRKNYKRGQKAADDIKREIDEEE